MRISKSLNLSGTFEMTGLVISSTDTPFSDSYKDISIPGNLFANNPDVITFGDQPIIHGGCFASCSSLISIPENLFANNLKVENYAWCFHRCENLTGNAPRLWDIAGVGCYSCFKYCTKLANYNEIPSSWK